MLLYNKTFLNINLKIQPKINHKKFIQERKKNESKEHHKRKQKQKTKLRQARKSLRRWRFSPYKVLFCCLFRRRQTGENVWKTPAFSPRLLQNPPVIPSVRIGVILEPLKVAFPSGDGEIGVQTHTSSRGMTGCLWVFYTEKKRDQGIKWGGGKRF